MYIINLIIIIPPIINPILNGNNCFKGNKCILANIFSNSSYSPKDIKIAVPLMPGIIVVKASKKPIKKKLLSKSIFGI